MRKVHVYAIGLVSLLCATAAKADPSFTDTFETYTPGALSSSTSWAISNGAPVSPGVWNVIQPSTGNLSVEFYTPTFAFTSPPRLTHTLQSSADSNWDLSLNYGFRYGVGGSPGNYVGAGSVMSGIELLDASGNGYRIVLKQGNSSATSGPGGNVILVYGVANNVVGSQISGGAMAGFCAPGWAQANGGAGYAQWRALEVTWNNGVLALKTDADLNGSLETSITLASQPSAWQLNSISLLSLSSGNTHSADFDNITLAVPEAASISLLGLGALAALKKQR